MAYTSVMEWMENLEIFRDDALPPEACPLREARLALAVRRFRVLLTLMVAVWLGCELAALAGWMPSAIGLALHGENPFWAGGFFGITFLYFWSRPTAWEFRGMVAGGLGLSLLLFVAGGWLGWQAPASQALNLGLGTAALIALLQRAVRSRGIIRTEALALCLPAFLTMGSTFILAVFFRLSPLRQETLDGVVYAAEQTLGGQPSFFFGRVFEAFPPLAAVSFVIYLNAHVPVLCVLGMQMRSARPPRVDIYTVFVAIAVVFSTLCILFPLVGPVFAFGAEFPQHPPAVDAVLNSVRTMPNAPRNCMPSGHTAWAILVWWHARPFGRGVRAAALGNLLFTVLATLGFGLHYLLDLIVAVPAAVAVQTVCMSPSPSRRVAICCGLSLTALWLLLIFAARNLLGFSVMLTDLLAFLTVIVPLVQEYTLYRQSRLDDSARDLSAVCDVPGAPSPSKELVGATR